MRRGASTSFVGALFLAQLCLAGDCVDGVTPDCSDAAAQCGPELRTTQGDSSTDARPDVVTATDAATDAGDQ